jgi:signal transduction histidine kinase/ActR/RegA family two-component response regulator/HAMP domain-containing protein
MKRSLLARMQGLRARTMAVMIGGLLFGALAFYASLLFLAREWLTIELKSELVEIARRTAGEAAVPLTIGDRADLAEIAERAARARNLVGAVIIDAQGRQVAARITRTDLWSEAPSDAPREVLRDVQVTATRRGRVRVLIAEVPVVRTIRALPSDDTGLAVEAPVPGKGSRQYLGRARVEVSTSRLESAMATASGIGLLVLAAVVLLSVIASLFLMRLAVRPLHEASQLARDIAAGNLDRRIPVRGEDELGTLAESLNIMAEALMMTMERERAEASALRDTAEAVISIERAARGAQDWGSAFEVLAHGLIRVTRCDVVALALGEEGGTVAFRRFEPAAYFEDVRVGLPLDGPLLNELANSEQAPVRASLEGGEPDFRGVLARQGMKVVLAVPLAVERGSAALLLISSDARAFGPAEKRVVTGLSSHLAAALRAGRLEEDLKRAFDELHRTREQLVRTERLRATGELAAGIAHEFNNVLAAILGRIELLRHRARRGTLEPNELMESFGVMELAARDGAETVRLLRQFSKGEESTTEAVDLDRVIRESIQFTRPSWKDAAEADGRTITVDVLSNPGTVIEGRASQLREVFTNLILNAVDALPHGGTIRIETALEAESAIVAVVDDGVGMSEETQRRLFDPFYTTKGTEGTGLGLSVVYGTVKRHHGSVMVRSKPGEGTRVELVFPRPANIPEPAPIPTHEAPAGGPGLRVMVVDDDAAVRDLLIEILEELGQTAAGFPDGEAALASFHPRRFDLVLTDLGMPRMNGWQLAEEIRSRDPETPIALITGWGEHVDQAQAERVGAERLISKPFAIEDIGDLVDDVAARRARRAA